MFLLLSSLWPLLAVLLLLFPSCQLHVPTVSSAYIMVWLYFLIMWFICLDFPHNTPNPSTGHGPLPVTHRQSQSHAPNDSASAPPEDQASRDDVLYPTHFTYLYLAQHFEAQAAIDQNCNLAKQRERKAEGRLGATVTEHCSAGSSPGSRVYLSELVRDPYHWISRCCTSTRSKLFGLGR
ncbi:hypothetical protein EDD17DRAFT_1515403 [Pisolithus thermaeus]|nr:hypothetical protein EDD17DRAFT_1515403 [Pisolithus thermaeus]